MHKMLLIIAGALALTACGSTSESYCAKAKECFIKDCDLTEDACNAYAEGEEKECVAELNFVLEATSGGDAAVCDRCVESYEIWLDCAANTGSCAAFDDADNSDGDCASEIRDVRDDCSDADIEDACW